MQLLRKISRATIIGDNTAVMEMCLANKTETHPLYRVYGWVNGTRKDTDIEKKPGDTRVSFGAWECLIGNMEAINLLTGEVSRSGQCFLPQFAVDLVAGQLGGDVERVKFAYQIGAKFDETTPTKYTYVVTSLIEPTENDPLADIAKALPAPPAKQLENKASKK